MNDSQKALARSSFGSQESVRIRKTVTPRQHSAVLNKLNQKKLLYQQKEGNQRLIGR